MGTSHEKMIEDIRDATGIIGGIELSQWEEEFVDSIEERLSDGESLTEAQGEKLEEIWNRV